MLQLQATGDRSYSEIPERAQVNADDVNVSHAFPDGLHH